VPVKVNLSHDPVLPQREAILCPALVAERLSGLLGAGEPLPVRGCHVARVNYQPGNSLRVVYELEVPGLPLIVAVRGFPSGRSDKSASAYAKAAATAMDYGGVRGVAHDPELNAVFWTFPNDRRLTRLARVWCTPGTLAWRFGQAWSRSRLVAYAPERSAMIECLGPAEEVLGYAKACTRDADTRQVAVYDALERSLPADDPHLQLPRLIAHACDEQVLLFEPISGDRLADHAAADRAPGLSRLGSALARLHAVPLATGRRFARFDLDQLARAANALGLVRPDVAPLAEALVPRVAARLATDDTPPVLLHGDVHLKNVILTDKRTALVDLEDVAIGPPAADVGSLLALLRYQRHVGLISSAQERRDGEAFLAGYAAVRPVPAPTTLAWYMAAALLVERALGAVHRLRSEGLQRLDALLADATALVS
jgi:aminoglycoside phosphotransferase (APT) family kinase protein